jgi:hypothetical protein
VSARDEVLGRVRAALGDAAAAPPVRRDYRTADHPLDLAPAELLDLLVERLVNYRALVRRAQRAGWRPPTACPRRGWSACRRGWSWSATGRRSPPPPSTRWTAC